MEWAISMRGNGLRFLALVVTSSMILTGYLAIFPSSYTPLEYEIPEDSCNVGILKPTAPFQRGTRAGPYWPLYRGDLPNTGYTTSSVPNNNTILWSNTTGSGDGYGSPVVEDGKVYVGSADGNLYCFDLYTGQRLWETMLSAADFGICGSPAVYDDHVYVFSSGDDALHALWTSNGTVDWSYDPGGGAYGGSSPAVTADRIYFGSGNRYLYSLDRTSGSLVWSYQTDSASIRNYGIQSSPAVANGRVFVGACDTYLYCFNEFQPTAPNANYLWRTSLVDGIFASPAVANGRVYCGSGYYNYGEGSNSHTLFCLDELTGGVEWSYTTGSDILSSPAIAYGNCYFTSTDGNLYCVDANHPGPSSPTPIWTNTTGDTWSSPAVSDGKVVVGSRGNNRIYCYNASSGMLVWDLNVGNDIYGSPAIADGKVVVSVRGNPESVVVFGSAVVMTVDQLVIEDGFHTELSTEGLSIGGAITAYAAGYNSSYGSFVRYVEVDWTGGGGNWNPSTGTSSTFTAGTIGGLYLQNAQNSTMVLSDDFEINILPPTLDYILITDGPAGSELGTVSIPIMDTVSAFASGYNSTGPTYLGLISVDWTGSGGSWLPTSGTSSTFTAGDIGGSYLQTGENTTLGVIDTFNIDVQPPTLDYILLTDAPNGVELTTVTMPIAGTTTAWASGYNSTGPTYYGLVEVDWTDSGGTWSPASGTSSTFTAGFTSGVYGQSAENLTLGVSDIFDIEIIGASLDYIEITDSPNGTPLGTVITLPGGLVDAYASGYNTTGSMYVGLVEVDWTGPGGLWSPGKATSSTFTAGGVVGLYIQTGENTSLGVSDTFTINITDWEVDYILITNSPGGTPLDTESIPIGGTVTAYASAYNNSGGGYLGLVEVEWDGLGGSWSPQTDTSSTFTADLVSGLFLQTGANSTMVLSYTFNISVLPPTMDYIRITETPGGAELVTATAPLGGTLTAYASGYNNTGSTYTGLVEVDWTGSGGTWSPILGTSSTFTAGSTAGLYGQTGENVTLGVSDTFDVDIIDATLDYIIITESPDGPQLTTVTLPIEGSVTAYASGYNYTGPTYVGLIEVEWTGSGGSWVPIIGSSSVFTAGSNDDTFMQTGQNNVLGVSDTFSVEVLPPTVDYIIITDSSDGTPLGTVVLPVGGNVTAYASGYNNTGQIFVELVDVTWVGSGGTWSSITSTSSTFFAGVIDGTYGQTGQNLGLNVFDTFNVNILPPTLDYILITDTPGGEPLGTVEIPVGGSVVAHASGYNNTGSLYLYLVAVNWTQSAQLGAFSLLYGYSTTYTARHIGGTITISGFNTALGVSDDFTLTVTDPKIDYIQIRDAADDLGNIVQDVSFTLGETVTATCL
jgi:outer membrane protein assembly factor BamB